MSFYNALVKNIQRRFSSHSRLKKIGLGYIKIKYLKHATDKKIKKYRLYNYDINYINGPDFLHSLLELFYEDIYKFEAGENPTIIDCGANVGLSMLYFYYNHPRAEIIGFEPDDVNFDLLSSNIKQLNADKVKIYKEAVWTENGYISFENTGGLGSKISSEETKSTTKIKSTRLKDLLTRKIDFLKMDIEGAEYGVIKDIKDNLHFVDRFFIEYHGKFANQAELLEILNIVKNAGFRFYIKEALSVFSTPFSRTTNINPYDIQLNIFCFK